MMFFLRDSMQGRQKAGNLTLAASKIKSQVCHTPSQAQSYEITSHDLSSDILTIMNEENIEIAAASPFSVCTQAVSNADESDPVCSISKRSIEQQSRSRSPSSSRSETPTEPRTKNMKTISVQEKLINIEREKIEWFKQSKEEDRDGTKQFLMSLIPLMKDLPPQKLSQLKLKIHTLVHETVYAEAEQ